MRRFSVVLCTMIVGGCSGSSDPYFDGGTGYYTSTDPSTEPTTNNCTNVVVCGNNNNINGAGADAGPNPTVNSVTQNEPYDSGATEEVVSNGSWSDCFDPTTTFPTGLLMYPGCTAYCQSIGKSCSTTCQGPDSLSTNGGFTSDSVLVWCGGQGTCGSLSSYPNEISTCENTIGSICVNPGSGTAWCAQENSSPDESIWYSNFYCGIHTLPTSAQCCCQ